jgi:hypothetical protein
MPKKISSFELFLLKNELVVPAAIKQELVQYVFPFKDFKDSESFLKSVYKKLDSTIQISIEEDFKLQSMFRQQKKSC